MNKKQIGVKNIFNIILFAISTLIIFYISFNNQLFINDLNNLLKDIIISRSLNLKHNILNIEKSYNSKFYLKNDFLEIYGTYAKFSDIRHLNERYKLDDGMLFEPLTSKAKEGLIENNFSKVLELFDFTQENNIPFMYIKFPDLTSNKNYKALPSINDYRAYDESIYSKILKDKGVKYINFDYIASDGKLENQFFKTDHHWLPELAFKAFVETAGILKNDYNVNIDENVIDINNYYIDIHKNLFLGAHGRRTGYVYSGFDDISLIYPKFDTHFTGELNGNSINGNYYESFLYLKHLSKDDIYNKSAYDVYGDMLMSMNVINKQAPNDFKLMLIHDSFTRPEACFMANAVHNLITIDVRYLNTKSSLKDLIKNVNPDLIIMQYNANTRAPIMFNLD